MFVRSLTPNYKPAEPVCIVEYIPNQNAELPGEEAAGKVGRVLGVVAGIFIPFAAPAIWGSIAASTGITAAIGSAAGWVSSVVNIVGSAVVGGVMNAGVAYASGARGGDVWRAFGSAALSSGVSAGITGPTTIGRTSWGRAMGVGANATAPGLTVPATTSPTTNGIVGGTSGVENAVAAAAPQTGGVAGRIMQQFGGEAGRRMAAAVLMAAVQGQNIRGMEGVVQEQMQELEALKRSNQAVYQQRIAEAQKILADADKMDPTWRAKMAMADVATAEKTQAQQTKRAIAARDGGSFDTGTQRAFDRKAGLHTARSKSLAYNKAFTDAEVARNQLRAAGMAGLAPDANGFGLWQAGAQLRAAQTRADNDARNEMAGFGAGLLLEGNYRPSTSPIPNSPEEDEDESGGI